MIDGRFRERLYTTGPSGWAHRVLAADREVAVARPRLSRHPLLSSDFRHVQEGVL